MPPKPKLLESAYCTCAGRASLGIQSRSHSGSGASKLIVLSGYIIALSLYLIGGPQWIDQHLPSEWTDSLRIKSVITLAKKLIVFVAIPFAIFRFSFGYRVRDFGVQREGLRALRGSHLLVVLVVGGVFAAFQYFFSGGSASFRHGHFTTYQLLLGLTLCFIWLFVEAGLVEEFFSAVLSNRTLAQRSNLK